MTTTGGHPAYEIFVERNVGVVNASTQERLRSARVLVAGCGSTGGAAVEPLVRLGIQHLDLVDPGTFELNNLNRQLAHDSELGQNKAEVARARAVGINPYADIRVGTCGLTADNVDGFVAGADLVIDGVDVTTTAGWEAKLALHEAAAARNRPVLTGWDMAGTQFVRYYDYGRGGRQPLHGAVSRAQLGETPWQLMARAVPIRHVPHEMLAEAMANLGNPEHSVSQVVYASELFGAIVARAAAVILAGGHPRREIVIDLHRAVASPTDRARRAAALTATRLRAVPAVVRLRRARDGTSAANASAGRPSTTGALTREAFSQTISL